MRFIADTMLGRLARWLRLLGFDTLYFSQVEDSLLMRIAREEDRVLLTRDTRIVKVRDMKKYLLLADNDPFAQLKTVIEEFDLISCKELQLSHMPQLLSRCSLCNKPLETMHREFVKGRVPAHVFTSLEVFKKCSNCDKLYWRGTHVEKLIEKLKKIMQCPI